MIDWWRHLIVDGVKEIRRDRMVSVMLNPIISNTPTSTIAISRRTTSTVIGASNGCGSDSIGRHDWMIHHLRRERRKRHRICKQHRRRHIVRIVPIGIILVEHLIILSSLGSSGLNLLQITLMLRLDLEKVLELELVLWREPRLEVETGRNPDSSGSVFQYVQSICQ
jgi:hypothetical protein